MFTKIICSFSILILFVSLAASQLKNDGRSIGSNNRIKNTFTNLMNKINIKKWISKTKDAAKSSVAWKTLSGLICDVVRTSDFKLSVGGLDFSTLLPGSDFFQRFRITSCYDSTSGQPVDLSLVQNQINQLLATNNPTQELSGIYQIKPETQSKKTVVSDENIQNNLAFISNNSNQNFINTYLYFFIIIFYLCILYRVSL